MGLFRVAMIAAVGAACMFAASPASAEDEQVTRRLTKHGKLSKGEAKRVVSTVTKAMGRSAGMTNDNGDPLRMAVSKALFGVPVPPDAMAQAKVRLRLYAGLNGWALDAMFKPRPGVLAECRSALSLKQDECEALVAASGRVSLADARELGDGAAVASGSFGTRGKRGFGKAPARSTFGRRPAAPPGGSRFKRYDSGFRAGGAAPRFKGQQGGSRFGNAPPPRAARPAPRAAPRPAPRAATNTKAEYQKRRAAYLARQKARMEQRKQKVVAAAGGTDRAERGPGSAEEAEAAGLAPPPENKEAPSAKAAAAPEESKAEEASAAPKKPANAALDNDLLNSLLDDPLGN